MPLGGSSFAVPVEMMFVEFYRQKTYVISKCKFTSIFFVKDADNIKEAFRGTEKNDMPANRVFPIPFQSVRLSPDMTPIGQALYSLHDALVVFIRLLQ